MTRHLGLQSFSHTEFSLARVREGVEALRARERGAAVSVCLPARNEARTIGPILRAVARLADGGIVDQVVVVDDSTDGTHEVARGHGVEVHSQEELSPEAGPVLGKGDAMWRALTVLEGNVVVYLDADTEDFDEHFVLGLLGPIVADPEIAFVKGHYRRPFRLGSITLPAGGGRVTELTARPLLELFYPELEQFRQPLAGEIAVRRDLLERLPFVTGYGVDIGLLIDAYRAVGLERMAQVDLEVRQNVHQPLHELGPMASAVLATVATRLAADGRLRDPFTGHTGDAPIERPARAAARSAA